MGGEHETYCLWPQASLIEPIVPDKGHQVAQKGEDIWARVGQVIAVSAGRPGH
jgi:hypothetical protein